ncbi:MAG: hypothetical protein KDD58_04165 [Bdellovibrionales bacterium]|nr:hypothetical protein [Bdellovibrionales bacterium]
MKLFIIYCLIIIALSDSSQAALYLGEYDFKIIKEGGATWSETSGGPDESSCFKDEFYSLRCQRYIERKRTTSFGYFIQLLETYSFISNREKTNFTKVEIVQIQIRAKLGTGIVLTSDVFLLNPEDIKIVSVHDEMPKERSPYYTYEQVGSELLKKWSKGNDGANPLGVTIQKEGLIIAVPSFDLGETNYNLIKEHVYSMFSQSHSKEAEDRSFRNVSNLSIYLQFVDKQGNSLALNYSNHALFRRLNLKPFGRFLEGTLYKKNVTGDDCDTILSMTEF